MATYVRMIKFTEKGIQNIQDTCKRAAAIKTAAKKMGVKVLQTYWTLGSIDGLLIFEAPDDETATAMVLHLDGLGFVKGETMRTFNSTEMEKILAARPTA